MAAPMQWGNTGHWYEFISTPTSATDAFTFAQASTFDGMHGYLATITSADENWFVSNDIAGGSFAWLGGSDAGAPINQFTWRNGPETGQAFTYTSWWRDDPNNVGGEDYVFTNYQIGLWVDYTDSPFHRGEPIGYVIEYGDTPLPLVPEPETYAMLLAGLGLLSIAAHRRKVTEA
ncbi:PEP motif putative anchor domain protein [Nitrosomonas sp. Is79A3]|uniref:PEP-CTERM sorting domain-containing protein n=1 Tax=Nitrosomonas sp. (strain Is79A3) TaxID=261292 RepID=UPI000215C8A8